MSSFDLPWNIQRIYLVLLGIKSFHSSIAYIMCGVNCLLSARVLVIYFLVINESHNNSEAV